MQRSRTDGDFMRLGSWLIECVHYRTRFTAASQPACKLLRLLRQSFAGRKFFTGRAAERPVRPASDKRPGPAIRAWPRPRRSFRQLRRPSSSVPVRSAVNCMRNRCASGHRRRTASATVDRGVGAHHFQHVADLIGDGFQAPRGRHAPCWCGPSCRGWRRGRRATNTARSDPAKAGTR